MVDFVERVAERVAESPVHNRNNVLCWSFKLLNGEKCVESRNQLRTFWYELDLVNQDSAAGFSRQYNPVSHICNAI